MTIAACSTRAAIARCSTRSARIDAGATARRASARWRAAEAALAAARAEIETAARDREWLEHAVAELTALAPEPGEEETLADTPRARCSAREKIADDLAAIDDLLDGSDGGLAQLRQAARVLERIAARHPALAEALAALDRAVSRRARPRTRLDAARRGAGVRSARAGGGRGAAVRPARAGAQAPRPARRAGRAGRRAARRGWTAIEAGERRASPRSSATVAAARAAYDAAADALSRGAHAAAARLDAAVAGELAPLKLDAARFRTVVAPLAEEQWGAGGQGPGRVRDLDQSRRAVRAADQDRIGRRTVALHPRAEGRAGRGRRRGDDDLRRDRPRRRRRGGERDRRAAGAAGRADASCWSSPTARRSRRAARDHLLIAKSHDGTVTRTGVRVLDERERREEIARMLSGATITDEARAQAERLLEAA